MYGMLRPQPQQAQPKPRERQTFMPREQQPAPGLGMQNVLPDYEQLLKSYGGGPAAAPRNVGEGLHHLGKSIFEAAKFNAGREALREKNAVIQAQKDQDNSAWSGYTSALEGGPNPEAERGAILGLLGNPGTREAGLGMLADWRQRQKAMQQDNGYDSRAEAAKRYNLDPNSPEGRQFILTGKIPATAGNPNADLQRQKLELEIGQLRDGDPLKAAKVRLLNQLMGDEGAQQPAPPPQQPPQGNATPGPVQPMSNDEGAVADPNLIPAQAAQEQPPPPPQQPQPEGAMQLSPEQRRAFGLNMVVPGAGNLLLKQQEAAEKRETWQTPTKNKIDENIFNTVEQSSRLSQIEAQFRPEFLTVGGGLRAMGAKWWEKVRGQGSLEPETQKYLEDFAAFKQGAISNINAYIKEVTGAQMSEAEAKRLRQGMPDPGDDPFGGDSPSEFKAKLEEKHRMMRLAMARYNYLRSGRWKGGTFTGSMAKGAPISLDQMQSIMGQRRQELQQAAKTQAPDDLQQQRAFVIQSMQQEFGI